MLNWWLGQGVTYLCAFVMSSSENFSPVQWLFSQVANNLGLSKANQDKLRSCHLSNCNCQGSPNYFVEAFNNTVLNFKIPCTNIKNIDSSTALFDISNKNSYNKAIIFLDSEGNLINCDNISVRNSDSVQLGENQNFISQSSDQLNTNKSYKSLLEDKYITTPLIYLQKLDSSASILEVAQDRMVTSPLSSNNVPFNNAYAVGDKKKSHRVERSSGTSNSKGFCGNRSKNKENFVKCKEPQLENKKDFTNKKKSEKNISECRDTSKLPNCKVQTENLVNDNVDEKSASSKHENRPDIEEVGILLQQVFGNNPSQGAERNNAVAKASSGGSDTGYSSRCSTPPAPGIVTDANADEEHADQKRISDSASIPLQNDVSEENRVSRSESPSSCSDSSSGSSSNSFRGRNNYQGGYQQRFNFYPQQHSQKPFHRPQYYIMPYIKAEEEEEQCRRQNNVFNGRMRNQGNNEARFNYRKLDRIPFHQNQQPQSHLQPQSQHSHSNSSHHQEVDKGGKPIQNGRFYNNHNQQKVDYNNQQKGDGKGRNWGMNQRYNNVKNRHYGNPNFQHPNYQSNAFSNANIYYQADSQLDLREQVWGYQRRLSDQSGTFTAPSGAGQGKWKKDHRIEATVNPPELLTNSEWDDLSLQVWKLFSKHQQLDSTFRAKMELKQRISHVIWNVLPMCRLFVVGSSLSGFGANSSDVDMCLMVTPRDLDQRNEAQAVLRLLQRELNNCGFVEKMELITAKVPILKFRDLHTKIDVDLNCNNSVGIRNTHLLNAYSQLDWRVRPLVLVVKLWAQHHHINNAKDMTISSYSLVLMVIHYLQCGLEIPLLPCLQKAFPDKFNAANHVFRMPVTERMPLFISKNKQTLGELFLGFLDYYANKFTFIENSISIRTGGILPTEECRFVRTRKNDSRMWKYLCIEEPFDLTNTARSVYDEVVFEKVKRVFKDSYKLLKDSKDLNAIFSRS